MTRMRFVWRNAVHCGVALGLTCVAAWSEDQPQWGERYTHNMVSREKGLPASFDPATRKNLKWVAALGTETHATPTIAGGRILIGTNNGRPRDPKHQGDRGVLMCLDEKDGHFLWQLVVPKREGDIYLDWPQSGMCSPATLEGDRIYMLNNRGEVMCLDALGLSNGNAGPFLEEGAHMAPRGGPPMTPGPTDADVLWSFDLVSGAGIYSHDAAMANILLHGPYLYLNSCNGVDNTHRRIRAPEGPSLVVLEKATGRYVARDNEGIGPRIFHCTWSSPALAELPGKNLIIFCGGDGVVYAFEPLDRAPPAGEVASLKRVWRFDCDPTAPKEEVHRFTSNRQQSPSNIKSMPVVYRNRVYVTGGGDLWWGKHQAWLKCIDATRTGDITATGELWSYPLNQHVMASPAIGDGLVFAADCARQVHCVDAETGKPYWTHDVKGDVWATPLVADGKVYLGTRRGRFWVFAASQEQRVLAELDLGEPISATAVAANGVLYVATMRDLFAVQATPFRVEATRALRAGNNSLEVRVANLWPNRLIGDAGLPENQRVTWTAWNPFKSDTPLLPSGLLGPVTLRTAP